MSPAPWSSARARVEPGACAPKVSLRVPHHRRSCECSRLGSGRKRRQVQNLFIPLETFGRMPPDQPEVLQPPRDVGRFSRTTALDEPRKSAAVALEIFAHAIQPFGLRRADQPLRSEGGFADAIARQSFQGIVALARSSELESRESPARFRASGTADASPVRSRLAARGSCRSSRPLCGARRRDWRRRPHHRQELPRLPRSEIDPAARRAGGIPAARSWRAADNSRRPSH